MFYHLKSDKGSTATHPAPRGHRQMPANLRADIRDGKPKPIELRLHYIKPETVYTI